MAEITEAKIRQAIWMLKAKKTKKAVFFKLKKIHNAEIGNANTDIAVIPLS